MNLFLMFHVEILSRDSADQLFLGRGVRIVCLFLVTLDFLCCCMLTCCIFWKKKTKQNKTHIHVIYLVFYSPLNVKYTLD
jgi:ABC-type uncharacterized transport system permease subunit